VNTVKDIMYYPNLDESVRSGLNKAVKDPKEAAKQVEQVFLNELLKNMFENTEFGKDKLVSSYMPYITSEISKSLSERGVGIHEFLMKNPTFRNMVIPKGTAEDHGSGEINKLNNPGIPGEGLKMPVRGAISSGYGRGVKVDHDMKAE
jgi:Rod binding domain-containing protein